MGPQRQPPMENEQELFVMQTVAMGYMGPLTQQSLLQRATRARSYQSESSIRQAHWGLLKHNLGSGLRNINQKALCNMQDTGVAAQYQSLRILCYIVERSTFDDGNPV